MTEMTEMRKFYANGVALVETQAMQLANQQASSSISDMLNRSPVKLMTPARNSASDTPDLGGTRPFFKITRMLSVRN